MLSAGAIFAKNQIVRHWSVAQLSMEERTMIRSHILGIIFSRSSPGVLEQIVAAAQFIVLEDFPSKWPSALDEIKSRIHIDDPQTIYRGFKLLDQSFEHIRKYPKCDESMIQVIQISECFASNILSIFDLSTRDLTFSSDVSIYLGLLAHTFSFYRSIITFDIPQYFVDNSAKVFRTIIFVLKCWNDSSSLVKNNKKQADTLLCNIMDVLIYYATCYEDDLECLPEITQLSLTIIVSNIGSTFGFIPFLLRFLSHVVKRDSVGDGFRDSASLLVEKVISPNLASSLSELEQMADDPIDYCREIQSSLTDEDSLLSAVSNLMRSMIACYPKEFSRASNEMIMALIDSGGDGALEQAIKLLSVCIFSEYDAQVFLLQYKLILDWCWSIE